MPINQLQLAEFMSYFKGNTSNYGEHIYKYDESEEKEKGSNKTIKGKLLNEVQYKAHLEGKKGLGVIPINEENKTQFGVIDVDLYKDDLDMYVDAIERNNFPLVPFRSKSGGLHIYLFLKSAVNAKSVINLLNKMAAVLSIDLLIKQKSNRIVEIFPKQSKLDKDKIGTWINLPYYNATKSRQCALKNGKELSLTDALIHIKEKRCTLDEAKTFMDELPFKDGPPCLQSIYLLNTLNKNSGRNNYLFSFGVYLKKKDESFFEQALFEINSTLKNPLSGEELEKTILSSLRRKDYQYKCNESPCVDFCKKNVCKTREYGVGKDGGYFSNLEYGRLVQYKAYDPYYEWEIRPQDSENGFKPLRFNNEDEIIKQDVFLRLCFRELKLLPSKLKQTEWFNIVNQSLQDMETIAVDKDSDTSRFSIFRGLFFNFLLDRTPAQTKDQILSKRVYYDRKQSFYYFRNADLSEFLWKQHFYDLGKTEIHGILRDMGCNDARIRTESGRQIRVSVLSIDDVQKHSSVTDSYFVNFDKELNEDF